MKKYFLLLLIALVGCTKTIDKDQLQKRDDGLFYEMNTNNPFTGVARIEEYGVERVKEHYSNGKIEGECTYRYGDGKIAVQKTYRNGKLYGEYISNYQYGQPKLEANFSDNGTLIGELKYWYENGQLKYDANIIDMSNIQLKAYDENGNIIEVEPDEFKVDLRSQTILR